MGMNSIIDNTVIDNITSLSYNSTGWSNFKADMINTILLTHSIMFCTIQEHFLLANNMYKIQQAFPDYDFFGLPAIKNNSQINSGRPSCGLAILYSKKVSNYVTHISCPKSNRVHAVKLNLPHSSYVFINCYLTVDKQNHENDVLLAVLQDIKYIIDQCEDSCNVVMLGDMNFQPTRVTDFANIIRTFLSDNDLLSVWSKFNCDFTYCFTRLTQGVQRTFYSILDHFIVSPDILELCVEATALHLVDNISNHEPIYLKFKCLPNKIPDVSCKKVDPSPLPQWNRASDDNIECFKRDLERNLSGIDIPSECLHCIDVHCTDVNHRLQIDMYAHDVMQAISDSVDNNIPFSRVSSDSKPPVPGWHEYVKPFRDDALFWLNVWKSAGKPENCVLHNVMKRTRNKYHYAIRKIRKHESAVRKDKFFQDIQCGNVNNIFDNIKKSRKTKSTNANIVDGVSGPQNISDLFKNIYSDVYNKYDDGDSKLRDLLTDTNNKVTQSDLCHVNRITESLVSNIICGMKNAKNDVDFNWRSDAIKHGSRELSSHFSSLFKTFIIHGHIPKQFQLCTLVPIPKGTKSKLCSDNYRLIGISSLVLKIFDHVILSLFRDNFNSPYLQFGYQKGLSTTMCTWGVLETIHYFTSRGSAMYLCLLDLTKAFDHVKHDTLFRKLSSKVPPIFLRLVLVIYLCQTCNVKWDGCYSSEFSVSNGVRQGAVASPLYFNVYLDDLFVHMKDSGLGCHIDNYFYGLFGYADDCALLSPSREGLQSMLDICAKYFADHGINISVNVIPEKSKTKCMAFNISDTPASLSLYNIMLPWVKSAIHLGHTITTHDVTNFDVLSHKAIFNSKVHELRQELGDQHPEVFISMVQTYLTSMYGSNLWELYHASANKLYSAWNFLIKNAFNLPYPTHRYITFNITNKTHIRVSLLRRFVNFYTALALCPKPEIVHLAHLQKSDQRSVFGRNCAQICNEFNVNSINELDCRDICMPSIMEERQEWRIPMLMDLINMRDDTNCDLPADVMTNFINIICCGD